MPNVIAVSFITLHKQSSLYADVKYVLLCTFPMKIMIYFVEEPHYKVLKENGEDFLLPTD
jgi:nicotinamide riboside transporter PnuC